MRPVAALGIAIFLSAFGLSTTAGQQSPPVVPAVAIKRAPEAAPRSLAKLSPQERAVYGGAKSAMDWLVRVNKPDGRFLSGFEPSLRAPLEGDSYLHQAMAAWALGQAAAHFEDNRAGALTKQALLTLLLETTVEAASQTRFTAAPDPLLSRLASGGLLALAIYAAPKPAADLQQQADQLINYLKAQQQADGSFKAAIDDAAAPPEMTQHAAGWALQAIMRSHAVRPGSWQLDAVRKAAAHYHAAWRKHKNLAAIPSHTAAYTEAYLAAKDARLAEAVFEMNDWLCNLQYVERDPRRPHWQGGFQHAPQGKATPAAPDVRTAEAARSLVHAYRVAKHAGDRARSERYRAAVASAVQFLGTLQYTDANTHHFAEWYRQSFLIGGFFTSHQDGSVRLEATAQSLGALVPYLQHALD